MKGSKSFSGMPLETALAHQAKAMARVAISWLAFVVLGLGWALIAEDVPSGAFDEFADVVGQPAANPVDLKSSSKVF